MASKKKEVVELAPVSAKANIEVSVFSEPVNGMLGTVIASDRPNGKFVRYAHAYLMEGGPQMSLDSKVGGRKVKFEDIERVTTILNLFADKVKEFYANR